MEMDEEEYYNEEEKSAEASSISQSKLFVRPKKSLGLKEVKQRQKNVARTPGEEMNMSHADDSIVGGCDIQMTSFDTRSGINHIKKSK